MRVLFVGDDQSTYAAIANLLPQATVEHVKAGDDVAQAVTGTGYDAYLVEGDQLAALPDTSKAWIAITDQAVVPSGVPAGAVDYLPKAELTADLLQRVIRYVSQTQRLRQDALESESRYSDLIGNITDGVILVDDGGKILKYNEVAHTLLDKDLKDKPLADVLPDVELGKTRQHTAGYVRVNIYGTAGGYYMCVLHDASKDDERDAHIQQLMILQQVNDELSQILSVEPVLALALDAAVRLSGADAGFIGLLDNNQIKLAQAIGHYTSILPDDIVPKTPIIKRIIDEPEPALIPDVTKDKDYSSMVNPKTKAQMLLPMMSYERLVGIINLETSRPERFTQGRFDFLKLIAGRVGVAVENAQLYKISQDQLLQLQELEQIKSDMIRIAAHDLRNPVSVILGYTELLLEYTMDGDISKNEHFLNMILRAAKRMEKITTDILSLERIEKLQSGEADPISINTLVHDLFQEFEGQAVQKSQTFTLEAVEDDMQVRVDTGQLREAMANLISNAIKYTADEGKITVKIRHEAGQVIFEVVDNGYGIQEVQQSNLFQPFFRAHSKETTDIEGTGLGLYLIKNIIERYNGSIIFHSVYGEGSTFGFKLPQA